MFRINVAKWERVVRFILGFLMLTWAIAGGASWGYLGFLIMATGCWGYSPLYAILGRRSLSGRED